MSKEKVWVFHAGVMDKMRQFKGICKEKPIEFFNTILDSKTLEFMDRSTAEVDPTYKQLIPYMYIKKDGKILTYQRTKKGGDKRLHDNYSLGVGGHINESDKQKVPYKTYQAARERELKEELNLKGWMVTRMRAVIYDDSNDVGKVHFGVVHEVELFNGNTMVPNHELSNVEFKTVGEIKNMNVNWENWSKLIVDNLL